MLVDGNGRLALVNRRTEEMFGYCTRCAVGGMVMLLPGGYRFAHVIHREVYGERPHRRRLGKVTELFGLRADGSEFPVEIGLSPIAVEAEDFAIAVIRDVSGRRATEVERAELERAQEARARAEAECARLASIMDEIDAIVWEADAERHRFSFVSARARELLGYPLSSWLTWRTSGGGSWSPRTWRWRSCASARRWAARAPTTTNTACATSTAAWCGCAIACAWRAPMAAAVACTA